MFNLQHSFIRPDLIVYSLSGVFLTFVYITPIQAKTPGKSQEIAQFPPGVAEERDFNSPYNPNRFNQNYSNFGPYRVLVDNPSPYSGLLQQLRGIEPTAFRKSHQGRSVIQVASFSDLNKAQNMVGQLQSNGFNTAYIIDGNNNRMGISNWNNNRQNLFNFDNRNNPIDNFNRQKTKYYYVAIPGKPNKLFQLQNQIQANLGANSQYVQLTPRNSPRGHHLAVGPFENRSQAEQWNNYFRSIGLKNARVYYGK